MDETLQALQEALLLQEVDRLPAADALPTAVLDGARQLQQTAYLSLLASDASRALLSAEGAPEVPSTAVEQLPVLFTGIACLELFFQLNWTGPDVPLDELVPLSVPHSRRAAPSSHPSCDLLSSPLVS